MEINPAARKAAKKRKRIIKVVIVLVIIAAILTAAVIFGKNYVSQQFASEEESTIETAEVETGSITATVSGSGTLTNDDVEEVTIPSDVSLSTMYVEEGDTVDEGDLLAYIDMNTALSALTDVQAQLDELDEQLEEASSDEVSETVTSGVAGRVKVIYAQEDDDVSTVVYENGALLTLSLDGYMAVDIDAADYTEGDSVTVVDSDGTSYDGTVSSVSGDTATILIDDDGPTYGDTVTVDDKYTGTLYINSPLNVTGYAGTVEEVNVSVDDEVESDDTLLTLTDTSYSANYNQILAEREEVEETFQTLIQLYNDGAVYAPCSGTIESVYDEDSTSSTSDATAAMYDNTSTTSSSSSTSGDTVVFTINPDETMSVSISVDETNILSIEEGQAVSVTIESISEDETYDGEVSAIDTTAASSDGVTTYTVTVTIEKTSDMMEGMTASASITIEGVDDALILPEDAVTNTSSTAYVYTSYDEETGELGDMVEVTVGLSNGSYVEITDGLSEGDTVYYSTTTVTDESSMFGGMGGGMSGDFGDFGGDTGGNTRGDTGGGMGGGNAGGGMTMPGN